jgi:hypothetical protein
MKHLIRESIKKHLLLEKKIGQIATNIKITFNFEINRKSHAFDRATRPELEDDGYNQQPIMNNEIRELISKVKREIGEKIIGREIFNKKPFIVKSHNMELAIVVVPVHGGGFSWRLEVVTVFRESKTNPFRVGPDQVVIWVD